MEAIDCPMSGTVELTVKGDDPAHFVFVQWIRDNWHVISECGFDEDGENIHIFDIGFMYGVTRLYDDADFGV